MRPLTIDLLTSDPAIASDYAVYTAALAGGDELKARAARRSLERAGVPACDLDGNGRAPHVVTGRGRRR
jgi:hypothetical protein